MIDQSASALSRRVTGSVASGLLAQGITVLLGLAIVPYMLRKLGNDGYALLAFSLSLVGYLSFVDLGLSNSLVRFLTEYDGKGDTKGKQDVISAGICLYPVLGLVAAGSLALLTPFLVSRVLDLPPELHGTALLVFYISSAGLPIILLKAYFEAIPMAHHRVSTVNGINVAMNSTKLICSAILLSRGFGLVGVVTANVAITFFHVLVLGWFALKCLPSDFRIEFRFDKHLLRAMLSNGLFVSATHLSSQLAINLDKLLIAAFLPMSALSYYVVASELALRLWYLPAQITRAYSPAFGYLWGQGNIESIRNQYQHAVMQVVIGISFVAVFAAVYSGPILQFWIGSDFAKIGARSLQMLALGTLMNCWSTAPLILMVAVGRAKTAAKIRFVVLVCNVVLCLILIPRFGINGAATAYLVSNVLDALLFYSGIERALLPGSMSSLMRRVVIPTALVCTATAALAYAMRGLTNGLVSLFLVCAGTFGVYLVASYYLVLSKQERHNVRSLFSPAAGTGDLVP